MYLNIELMTLVKLAWNGNIKQNNVHYVARIQQIYTLTNVTF